MILEAFSTHLRANHRPDKPPERVLMEWLTSILLMPPAPGDHVSRVIHTEIAMSECDGQFLFEGTSPTGRELLRSLALYCRSYDHWQFSRWVHEVQASDFQQYRYGS